MFVFEVERVFKNYMCQKNSVSDNIANQFNNVNALITIFCLPITDNSYSGFYGFQANKSLST